MTERDTVRSGQQRALTWSLVLNGGFLIAEVVGGIVFGSLALLADAAHMLSDVAGLMVALVAQRLIDRPASTQHTFGLQRAEVLGAQANGLLLLATGGWIIYEAISRLASGETIEVAGGGLLVVATLGLLVNVGSALMLHRHRGDSMNMRGALTHMLADAGGSVAAMVAGAAVLWFGAAWVDPAASILIAVLVLWSSGRLLRDTTHVLLEGVPEGLDVAEVEAALDSDEAVRSVHHLHMWSLASDVPALSAHIVMDGSYSLHDAQTEATRLSGMVTDRFGIQHTTFQIECHPHEDHAQPPSACPDCPPD